MLTPVEVLSRQLTQHRRRCERILRALEREPATAFDLGAQLWSEATVREQPLLVVWEVLGHLDLLLAAGVAAEYLDDDGRWRYSLARMERHGAGHLAVAS